MINKEQLLVFTGVVLVLFFALLLLTAKKYRSRPNKYLAIAVFLLAILILKIEGILEETFLDYLFNFFRIEYLFSFLLYRYVVTTLEKPVARYTYISLLIPFTLLSLLYSIATISDWYDHESASMLLEQIERFEIYLIIAFNLLVIILFTWEVKKSNGQKSFKNWIYLIAGGLAMVLISLFILEIIELLVDRYYGGHIRITVSLFFMAITYFGVQRLQIAQELKELRSIAKSSKSTTQKSKNNTATNHFERMQQAMQEETLFKDEDFDREVLASKLGLSVGSVTRILKNEAQLSFNDYVNRYRIELAKTMLSDPRFHIFSLEAIGREVGFKSRSAFYQSFKKEVGLSPGVFKKQQTLSSFLPDD